MAVAVAAFLLGVTKGGLSGLGPLLPLVVSFAVPTSVALGVLLPLLMIGDVLALWAHWRHWDGEIVRRILPGAALGVLVASIFLQSVSDDGLRIFLAVSVLAFTCYRMAEPIIRARTALREPKPIAGVWGWVAGGVSGVTSTVAHVGGPPLAVYLLSARVKPRPYVATSAALFFFINWMKVPGYLAADLFDRELLVALAPAALLILPGVLAGRWVVARIQQRVFDWFIIGSLAVGAILLLIG